MRLYETDISDCQGHIQHPIIEKRRRKRKCFFVIYRFKFLFFKKFLLLHVGHLQTVYSKNGSFPYITGNYGFFFDHLLNNLQLMCNRCSWRVYLCPLTADVLKTLIFYINNNYLPDSEKQIISKAFLFVIKINQLNLEL